jgi:hypothetical protein
MTLTQLLTPKVKHFENSFQWYIKNLNTGALLDINGAHRVHTLFSGTSLITVRGGGLKDGSDNSNSLSHPSNLFRSFIIHVMITLVI